MTSSNLIPILALAGAGSVMLIFWGAGKFTKTSENEIVAVNTVEETVTDTKSTSDDSGYNFSWGDESEASPTPAATDEPAETTDEPAETAVVEPSSSEDSDAFDIAEATNESPEPTVADSVDVEIEEGYAPFNDSESTINNEPKVAEKSSEPTNNVAESKSPLESEPKATPTENDWAVTDSKEFNDSLEQPLSESIEPLNADPTDSNGGVEKVASSEPTEFGPADLEPVDLEPVADPIEVEPTELEPIENDIASEVVPEIMFLLSITNLSGDTANFCIDGQAVTLTAGQSFVTEKLGSETFEYRESCEQDSSVPMKAGRYNVKAFPKSAQPQNQAYRAKSASQN